MALRYYDEALANLISTWTTSTIKVLKPDETNRLFQNLSDEKKDKNIKLPIIALSREKDIELKMNVRNSMSFNGVKLNTGQKVGTLDAIPVNLVYQLDIYTKDYDDADEYLRNFVFGIINNSKLEVYIPYKNAHLKHRAHMKLLEHIADNSDIAERLFDTQFTRFTLQIEIEDAYFFNVPTHKTWNIDSTDTGELIIDDNKLDNDEIIELEESTTNRI